VDRVYRDAGSALACPDCCLEWFMHKYAADPARAAALYPPDRQNQPQPEGRTMARTQYTPSSCPVVPRPDPVLLFIQQAQLTLVYAPGAR
jgi:hypothetical protein